MKKTKILCVFLFSLLILNSCSSDDTEVAQEENVNDTALPILTTLEISLITSNSAESGGVVSYGGDSSIVSRGVCWGVSTEPTINNSIATGDLSTETFTVLLSELTANTTYYVRAFASNETGIAYGNELSFTTYEEVTLDIPCSPENNSAVFNLSNLEYNTVSYYTNSSGGLINGRYGLVGNGNNSDLVIEFYNEPETGVYQTKVGSLDFWDGNDNKCSVSGVFGGTFSFYYIGESGKNVYVEKISEGMYSMTFCDISFGAAGTSYVFSTDGNLTN